MTKRKLIILVILILLALISISIKNRTYAEKEEVILYTVKSGDCLSLLAEKYNTSVSDIRFRNKLNNEVINVGRVLEIAVKK